jgi:uncharacterized protein YbcI
MAPPGDPEQGRPLLGQISTEIVRAFKQYYGKGPTKAKSYFLDDVLIVILRGGILQAEQTMVEVGQEDAVREFRQRFENEMSERLTHLVEQLTARKVINYQSQILFDPDMSVEIFVFDRERDEAHRRETVEALTRPHAALAEARDDETETA